MLPKFSMPILLLLLFFACKSKTTPCIIKFDCIINKGKDRVLTSSSGRSITDVRDIGQDTVIGGYYSFYKNGLLKSYYFIDQVDSSYRSEKGDELVETDPDSSNIHSYCSYAELYDSAGRLKRVLGNPFVHSKAEYLEGDSARVSLYFFSLNKTYSDLQIKQGRGNPFKVKLIKDELYSNMKKAVFVYSFKEQKEIEIYLDMEYVNNCSNEKGSILDSISVHSR